MNRLAIVAATVLAATQLVACLSPTGGGCGGGGENLVFSRGQDQLVLCDSGGFVLDLGTSQTGGLYVQEDVTDVSNPDVVYDATVDNTTQVAFKLTLDSSNGTATAPQLGSGNWTLLDLDANDLDTSNRLCKDLESQPWWPQTATP